MVVRWWGSDRWVWWVIDVLSEGWLVNESKCMCVVLGCWIDGALVRGVWWWEVELVSENSKVSVVCES